MILYPDRSLFRSSKILKYRNRVVFLSLVLCSPGKWAWHGLPGIIHSPCRRMLSTDWGEGNFFQKIYFLTAFWNAVFSAVIS